MNAAHFNIYFMEVLLQERLCKREGMISFAVSDFKFRICWKRHKEKDMLIKADESGQKSFKSNLLTLISEFFSSTQEERATT